MTNMEQMHQIELGSIVSVRWVDIIHQDNLDENEAKKLVPVECVSYGRLLADTEEKLIIVSTEFVDGEKRECTCMPKCVVKSIKELREV